MQTTAPPTPSELLTSVYPWVNLLTTRFAERLRLDVADLRQEATLRILLRSHRFNPAKSAPTT